MAHIPVMLEESLQAFRGKKIEYFFDGTLGAGGFAYHLLKEHPEIKTYIGCDRDASALEIAKGNLEAFGDKVKYVHGNFCDLDQLLEEVGIDHVDGFFLI